MTASDSSSAMDLAAHLCLRLCHDLAGPIGAVGGALDLVAEASAAAAALDLARRAARESAGRLIFWRLAYGGGEQVLGGGLDGVNEALAGFFDAEKHRLSWSPPPQGLDPDHLRLLLNMSVYAREAVPGGGTIAFTLDERPDAAPRPVRIVCRGRRARLPKLVPAADRPADRPTDRDDVHRRFLGALASRLQLRLHAEESDGAVILDARRAPSVA